VVSVELDPEVAALAAKNERPDFVHLEVGDALEVLRRGVRWDLIFADAQGGKWDGLDDTINALKPGGVLLVDDMSPPSFMNEQHREKTIEVGERLLADDRLVAVEIAWSSGIILCTRRR
jgi:demethylmenaquinone methyltransferase/2-methoxy-6-polyprenyl-1,4-benzoquinol methylase